MSTWRPIHPPAFWQRWLPRWLHPPVRFLFVLTVIGLVLFSAFLFVYFLLAMPYDMTDVAKQPNDVTYYNREGAEILVAGDHSRKLVKRNEIPEFLINSLRAREDARFFEHSGVDFRGLLRATLRNLKDRDFTQGASTVSMQLARTSFGLKQKSLHGKFLAIALTLRLEARYTKDEILTYYLNGIYFGAGANGIEQAAQTYFGKSTKDLSDGECAMLVGIIRGPNKFSPLRDLPAATEQRDQTLTRLIAMGLIDSARRDAIMAAPIILAGEEKRESQTSYALQAVRKELNQILEADDIQLGGLKIYTTLDSAWQNRLEDELTHAVEDLEHEKTWKNPVPADHIAGTETGYLQYAAVTTEQQTGAILALIGGRNYSDSRLDRSLARRDLGSAFEPFIAAAVADRGKLVIIGKPIQTGRQVGPQEVQRIAKRCGITGPFLDTEDLFRGAVASTPREMSQGLAALAHEGKRPTPYLIREIRDAKDEVIYTAKPQHYPAISLSAARDAASVLRHSGGTRCFIGATASERDAWTLRIGPTGATAIWLGFDQPTAIAPEPRLKSLLGEFIQRLGNQ